jgi:copper resistance protein C
MKRTVGITLFASLLLSLWPLGGPASAHDEILGTTPVANSTVAAGVIDVSVSFNEPIMTTPDNAGEVIEVVGPEGSDSQIWSNGCTAVSGAKVSSQVDLDQAGKYTVNWRSVSNDGHPSEGSFDFTLKNDSGYKSSGLVEPGPDCAAGTATPMAISARVDKSNGVTAATPSQGDAALPIAFGTIAVAIALLVGFIAVRRRRKH